VPRDANSTSRGPVVLNLWYAVPRTKGQTLPGSVSEESPRLLLVDDCAEYGETCVQLLSDHYHVVGQLGDAGALHLAIQELDPEIILLDISMPGMNGLDAAARLHRDLPDIKVIFLTAHSEWGYISRAFQIGAYGYVLKSSPYDLIVCLQQVVLDGRYLNPQLRPLP
jgi:DNA-binding NarL/FixJ family response regulator